MITKDTQWNEIMAQARAGTSLGWVVQQTVWLVTVVIEIEGHGKQSFPEYTDAEGIGEAISDATRDACAFVQGYFARDV